MAYGQDLSTSKNQIMEKNILSSKQEFHVKNCITNRQTSSNKRKYIRIYLRMIIQGMGITNRQISSNKPKCTKIYLHMIMQGMGRK